MNELIFKSATAIAKAIRDRAVSAEEVVEAHLRRIDEVNPKLNAVVQTVADRAIAEARESDSALARGEVVITDRYYLSNVAYQGARGLSPQAILERNEALFPAPDAMVLLETSPGLGLGRVRARGEELNRAYEKEEFLDRVAAIYAAIERSYLVRVAADGRPEDVHRAVLDALAPLLGIGDPSPGSRNPG